MLAKQSRELSYSLFNYKHDLSYEDYQSLVNEFSQGDYVSVMTFTEYYLWYRRSCCNHMEGGHLSDSAQSYINDYMRKKDAGEIPHHHRWLCQHMNLHPRLSPLVLDHLNELYAQ